MLICEFYNQNERGKFDSVVYTSMWGVSCTLAVAFQPLSEDFDATAAKFTATATGTASCAANELHSFYGNVSKKLILVFTRGPNFMVSILIKSSLNDHGSG